MNDEQRKAMFAKQGSKGHGISSGIRSKVNDNVTNKFCFMCDKVGHNTLEHESLVSKNGKYDDYDKLKNKLTLKKSEDPELRRIQDSQPIFDFIAKHPHGVSLIDLDREFGHDERWMKKIDFLERKGFIKTGGWKPQHHPDYKEGGSYLLMVEPELLQTSP